MSTVQKNPTTAKRDSIIEQIRKLRRMTEANGCSESEALTAASQVARLVAKYNVDETELRLQQDAHGLVDDSYAVPGKSTAFQQHICRAIAKLLNVKVRWRCRNEDPLGMDMDSPWTTVKFYGYPLDVEAAVTLAAICQTSIMQEERSFRKRTATRAKDKLESFHFGICERLAERIRGFAPQAPTSHGTALVVLKSQLVTQHYASHISDLGLGIRHDFSTEIVLDQTAYTAGRTHAENVNLRQYDTTQPAPAQLGDR